MVNVFGMDTKADKMDGDVFIAKRLSKELLAKQDEAKKRLDDIGKKCEPSDFVVVLSYVLAIFGLLMLILFIVPILDGCNSSLTVQELINSGFVYLIMAILAFGGHIGIRVFFAARKKEVFTGGDLENALNDARRTLFDCYDELGVPSNAERIDVFAFVYHLARSRSFNGKVLSVNDNLVIEASVFVDNDALCFSDSTQVIVVPFAEITSLNRVDEKMNFYGWNKKNSFTEQRFLNFGLKIIGKDLHFEIPYSYSIRILHDGTEYEINLPPYEFDFINGLIGDKVPLTIVENLQ